MGRARGGMRARIAGWLFLVLASAWAVPAVAQRWVPIGPDGGDVRSLTYDPTRENRIYLGTSSGQLFVSTDNGESWVRLAHLGEGDDTVIDHIAIDPQTGTLFAATGSYVPVVHIWPPVAPPLLGSVPPAGGVL